MQCSGIDKAKEKDRYICSCGQLAISNQVSLQLIQWNLSYPGSVGPRGARNFKIARNSELIHELCTYSTWLYENTGHKYIKHKNVYMYGLQTMIPLEEKCL